MFTLRRCGSGWVLAVYACWTGSVITLPLKFREHAIGERKQCKTNAHHPASYFLLRVRIPPQIVRRETRFQCAGHPHRGLPSLKGQWGEGSYFA